MWLQLDMPMVNRIQAMKSLLAWPLLLKIYIYLNFRKLPSFKRTVKFLLEGLIVLLKCHPFNPD